jgi:hypothetical protein
MSLIGKYWTGCNIDHLDVVTAFPNSGINDDNIYRTLPEGWLKGLNAPMIIVRLRQALYVLKQVPRLWHDDINVFLLHMSLCQSQPDLRSDSIVILLFVCLFVCNHIAFTPKGCPAKLPKLASR